MHSQVMDVQRGSRAYTCIYWPDDRAPTDKELAELLVGLPVPSAIPNLLLNQPHQASHIYRNIPATPTEHNQPKLPIFIGLRAHQ